VRSVALVGPTGSGKSALSIPLARTLGAEVISLDSRQLYRGMSIGTDRIPLEERGGIPHHGFDLVDPSERWSAGRYARWARDRIWEIRGRGRTPLFVGGTGFFLRALTHPVFREPDLDPERRAGLVRVLTPLGEGELARWVDQLDPERAELSRRGGRQRLLRTLELALLTGRPLSWWHRHAEPEAEPEAVAVILLELPREELYRRIDARAATLFRRGLVDELRTLLDKGIRPTDPGMTGIGYREGLQLLRGEIDEGEAVARIQRATRAYARRQVTWFRHQLPDGHLVVDGTRPREGLLQEISEWLAGTEAGSAG